MDILGEFQNYFQSARNIQEKQKISQLVKAHISKFYQSPQIISSYGEDSAAIVVCSESDPGSGRDIRLSENLTLISTDSLLSSFVSKFPERAGFSAIYLGIEDIYAAAGKPIAATCVVEFSDAQLGRKIFEGLQKGSQYFKIPIVRGHTNTDSPNTSLSITVIGSVHSKDYLSIANLNFDDQLYLIWSSKGQRGLANSMYWDTITHKNYKLFISHRDFIVYLSKNRHITFCKDVSNGGVLGTLFQICEYKKWGCDIQLDNFKNVQYSPLNIEYNLLEFFQAFLTSGFIVSVKPSMEESFNQLSFPSFLNKIKLGKFNTRSTISMFSVENREEKRIDLPIKEEKIA